VPSIGQLPFISSRILLQKRFADNKSKYCITQKLKLFVIASSPFTGTVGKGGIFRSFRLTRRNTMTRPLGAPRPVCQSPLKQRSIPKSIINTLLKQFNACAHEELSLI